MRKLFTVAALMGAALLPVEAATTFTLESVIVNPGTVNNAIQLTLTNTGPGSITVGGFSFGVGVAPLSGISFATADDSTTQPYIFAGNSMFAPVLLISGAGSSDMVGGDAYLTPLSGATIGSGVTVGLARILFDVDIAATPGVVNAVISQLLSNSSLSDANGAPITIDNFVNGTITVNGSVVIPEPSTFVLLGAGLLGVGLVRRRVRG